MNAYMWWAIGLVGYVLMGVVTWLVYIFCTPEGDVCVMVHEHAFPEGSKDDANSMAQWLACWGAMTLCWPVSFLAEGCALVIASVACVLPWIPFARKLLK